MVNCFYWWTKSRHCEDKSRGLCVTMLYVSCLIYVKTLAAVRPMAVSQNSTFYFFSLEVMRTQFIYDSSLLHVINEKTKKKCSTFLSFV